MALNLLQERLPGHISFGVTRDGRIFFVDDRTRTTSWIHPILGHPIQTGHSAVRGLPDGWEQAVTPEGAIYFIDHNTNTTTFEHPVTGRTASHDGRGAPQSPSSPHSPGNPRSPLKSPRSPTKLRALKAPAAKREQSAMVSLKGWLYRQESGGLKSWKKRYCVLADFGLFFYKDDKEHHSVGSILLPSYRISPCYSGECNKRFAFKAEHNNMKTYFFATDSQNDMERWINALKSAASLKGPPKRSPEPNNNKPKLIPKSAFMEWDDDDEGDPNKKPGGSQVFFPPNKDIPNTQSAFGPYQGQGQPRSTSAPINSRGQSPEGSRQGYHHSPMKPSAPNFPGDIHSHPNYPADRNSRASNYGNDQRPNEQNYESLSRYHNTQAPLQGQRSNNQDLRNRYPTEPARKNENPTHRSHEHGYPVHQPHNQHKVDSKMRPHEGYPNYSEAAYDRLHGKPPGDDRIPPGSNNYPQSSSNYPQSSSNYPHGQDNLYSKPLKKMARDLSPHERFEGRGGRLDKDHRGSHGDPRERSYWSPPENDLYVRTSQDPRTMERPDLIPNSNHSRETSETSNYGYYSPQRAEAQQLNRLYGQDNSSHDPRVLHHGKIKHSSEPDDANKQQPKEPPRLYLQDQTQQNQPPRSDGSIPNNNLYVDIPHTYVNIGDALSHRYDNETSPLPNRPPLPTAVRSQYVEELAQLKTPQTSQELLEAERNLEQRMQQPAYFSYPTPTVEERQFPMSSSDQYSSHHAEPRYVSQQQRPNTLGIQGIQDQDPRRPNTRGRGGKKPVGGGIHTVKEDPDMPDSQIIETAGIPNINSKYPGLGGGRIRMSISAGDLIGKTHDELVLMLIQLRREQTSVEKLRNFYRERIEQGRPAELRYKQLIQESRSALDPRSEQEHEEHMELRFQLEEVEKKLEVYRPLVNLVHNMVNMGSLYGGDNYMMATQYRKHLLSPEEYTPPKKMIEFSRKYQEEEIVRGMKDDIKQLTKDEVDLEEKLERLYELDRLLQEQSFRVTSHQGDKDLLEKALSGILRQQDMSRDNPRDLDNLIRQQRTIEKELSRVMHHLAEASKELEETTAENNKVEHEVTLLRSKVQGDLNRSKSAPSLSDENYKNKMKMEKDLARVQDIMAGLNEQQAELSEAMKRLRRSSSGAGLDKLFTNGDRDTNPVIKSPKEKLPTTYMETDVDTLESKDLSQVHEVLHSFTNATSLNSQYPSSNQAVPDSTRYETIVGHKNESFGSSPTSPQNNTRTTEMSAGEWDISEADDNTKRFFDSPWSTYKSGQDKQVEQNPGNTAVNGNHPVYENLPPVNSTHKSWSSVLPSNSSSAPSSRRSSSLHLMGPRPFVPFHLQQSNTPSPVTISHVESPVQMSNMSNTFQQPQSDDVVKATRVIIQPPFNGTEEDGDNQPAVYTPKPFVREYSPVKTGLFNIKRTPRGRYMTISSSQPVKLETSLIQPTSLHTSAGDLMTSNSMDMVPDIVKSSRTTVEPDHLDEAALEREILYMPCKVEIPERYLPDSDEESVTEEEKIKREEKAEKIKQLLTNSSVQHSLSQPDVSKVAGEIHQKVQEQKMKRAHLLAVSQELAKQVTLKSRQAAAERAQRRKTWSGSPSKGSDPILDPDDLEVDRTMGSLEYLAPHHRIQENMYI